MRMPERANAKEGNLDRFLSRSGFHLTFSQKRILSAIIPEVCLREGSSVVDFLRRKEVRRLVSSRLDPVQKGKRIFHLIRSLRYPLSGGKMEKRGDPGNEKVKLDPVRTRGKLVNPYHYGRGIFDLKETVISFGTPCPLDCAYCFINEFRARRPSVFRTDFSRLQEEIMELREKAEGPLYLNAGENADSLIINEKTKAVVKLIRIVEPLENVWIEFRTKTNKIEGLQSIPYKHKVVAAFSLGPEADRAFLESLTASISERISAMAILGQAGFRLGLRFEPIVLTKDYLQKYKDLFRQVFSSVSPQQVHSVSLGCLRLTKGLYGKLKRSHPAILTPEWILGEDGKMKYCQDLRAEIYSKLLLILKDFFPWEKRIVLSTEPEEVWRSSGISLKTMPELCRLENELPSCFPCPG